ncbi:Na+/H+ antiporter NhaC family protein [Psychrobacillus lasiicapitis]|uniref:Na+/H+ antiporter NhaC family protein n=1 Tax=Psychrobacillus lasiicapitis TaxID=1636719 RepID=A0A544T091_9BACI|nr:Na+/H+ antiporter NhaC family protein [Psychrobacillus lasiicapitis]TQR10800.1 Na+/H+ antiporter NhaC family protein [Psychrobacillus lasiicapitis]GGA42361.1 Na+/H+ antiporter [Psychrobacillus lasiicapitis]
MENTIYSLVPPLLAIIMVLVTKRVILSLGVGIVSAALLVENFAPANSLLLLWESFRTSFWEEGINASNIYILLFILMLGVVTAFVSLSGGSTAFAAWAIKKIKTRRGSKLLTAFLGMLIFVDDYFNALAVGQIARPITDSHRISRAKLSYFIDSTSAPICVVSPVSSWGAFLISQLGVIFATHAVTAYTPLEAFVLMAPMNFYVLATLAIVFFLAWTDFDIMEMKKHEKRAIETGELFDSSKPNPGNLEGNFPENNYGKVVDLVLPIVSLIVVTLFAMFWTGYRFSGYELNLFVIFENTDVPFSLFIGGLVATILAIVLYVRQFNTNPEASINLVWKAIVTGIRSMLPAIFILIFAWSLSFLINALETGVFLANLVTDNNIPVGVIPALLFVLTAFMAFATGSSWGSFGILLPIGASIIMAIEPELILPVLSAVLAGAVFGDHCSPISDTTIMSATGAGVNVIDHVITQLPYAITSAVIAAIGYLVLGLSDSILIGFVSVIGMLIVLFVVWNAKNKKEMEAN